MHWFNSLLERAVLLKRNWFHTRYEGDPHWNGLSVWNRHDLYSRGFILRLNARGIRYRYSRVTKKHHWSRIRYQLPPVSAVEIEPVDMYSYPISTIREPWDNVANAVRIFAEDALRRKSKGTVDGRSSEQGPQS